MSECKLLLGRALVTRNEYTQDLHTKAYSIQGVKCRGALNCLERSFYGSNFSPFKQGLRRARGGSSRSLGDAFHRHVFHKYKCAHVDCKCPLPLIDLTKKTKTPIKKKKVCRCKPTCVCKERFGRRTLNLKKNANAIQDMLKSFSQFLRETGLHVYDCEMIVGCRDIRVATSIDVVCVDNLKTPTKVFVIELKTGYTVQLKTVRTVKGTGNFMTGEAGKSIPNSLYNHHQLQLWFGAEALRKTHGIEAAGGYVVYVNRGHRLKYYAAESWWAKSTAMKTKMFSQLEKTCL